MIEIWLTEGTDRLRLPVLPAEIAIQHSGGAQRAVEQIGRWRFLETHVGRRSANVERSLLAFGKGRYGRTFKARQR